MDCLTRTCTQVPMPLYYLSWYLQFAFPFSLLSLDHPYCHLVRYTFRIYHFSPIIRIPLCSKRKKVCLMAFNLVWFERNSRIGTKVTVFKMSIEVGISWWVDHQLGGTGGITIRISFALRNKKNGGTGGGKNRKTNREKMSSEGKTNVANKIGWSHQVQL